MPPMKQLIRGTQIEKNVTEWAMQNDSYWEDVGFMNVVSGK